jgi:hypothetical protein
MPFRRDETLTTINCMGYLAADVCPLACSGLIPPESHRRTLERCVPPSWKTGFSVKYTSNKNEGRRCLSGGMRP